MQRLIEEAGNMITIDPYLILLAAWLAFALLLVARPTVKK
jgi:preprotein translocase subunit Sec61beta